MGLGNRTARQHQTVRTAAVDSDTSTWDFQPKQRVMTADGFSGVVSSVESGPYQGSESYEVVLDNGLGGGQYTASQLSAVPETTASIHTAADDYPELGTILQDRPDIARNTVFASNSFVPYDPSQQAHTAAYSGPLDVEHDNDSHCPECGQFVRESVDGMHMDRHLADQHGIERTASNEDNDEPSDAKDSGVDEHGHLTWDGNSPACRDTDGYSMFGDSDVAPHYASADAWGRPLMQAYDGHDSFACNNPDCVQHPQHMYEQGHGLAGMPGYITHENDPHRALTDEIDKHFHTSPEMKDSHWLLDQQHDGPSHLSSIQPTAKTRHKHHHPIEPYHGYVPFVGAIGGWGWPGCGACSDGDKGAEQSAFQGGGDASGSAGDSGSAGGTTAAFNPWSLVREAAADPDFRFHVVATWADVRNKAKRLRAEGRVVLTSYSDGMVHGTVKGDHHVYETGIQRLPGRTAVSSWSCGCKWGAYHWGASDDFSRFAGRMCSHALAIQYEAQSRGMFGREVVPDAKQPSWVPRRVVVKYDIDTGRDVSAPAANHTPSRSDYGIMASRSPMALLGSHAVRQGYPMEIFAKALQESRLDVRTAGRVMASVNSPFGEPSPPPTHYQPGPTKPRDPNENPASAGFASQPDEAGWVKPNPEMSFATTTIASRHQPSAPDDEALFEPEFKTAAGMDKEAFLPLLLEALPAAAEAIGLGGGAAGAGAAGAGAAETAAGFGARDVAKGVGKSVVHRELFHNQGPDGDGPAGPQGPQGPGDPGDDEADLSSRNPLDFHANAQSTLNDEPEPALPSTDGSEGDEESIDSIVAHFQATAGAGALMKESAKTFSPAEQRALIDEPGRHSNTDRLRLEGTHYAPMEDALSSGVNDEEIWTA